MIPLFMARWTPRLSFGMTIMMTPVTVGKKSPVHTACNNLQANNAGKLGASMARPLPSARAPPPRKKTTRNPSLFSKNAASVTLVAATTRYPTTTQFATESVRENSSASFGSDMLIMLSLNEAAKEQASRTGTTALLAFAVAFRGFCMHIL